MPFIRFSAGITTHMVVENVKWILSRETYFVKIVITLFISTDNWIPCSCSLVLTFLIIKFVRVATWDDWEWTRDKQVRKGLPCTLSALSHVTYLGGGHNNNHIVQCTDDLESIVHSCTNVHWSGLPKTIWRDFNLGITFFIKNLNCELCLNLLYLNEI
jgi:hypothetical protein